MDFENQDVAKWVAPFVKSGAFNTYWTYSFIGHSPFYAMVSPQYTDFYNRFIKNWLWWADGYVPYFHNAQTGIPSTRLAGALVDKVSRKIVGGRIMFKNAGKDDTKETVNKAIKAIGDWAKETDFEESVKRAVRYAAAGGTALMKVDVGTDNALHTYPLRMDEFIPTVDAYGNVIAVDCFIKCFTDVGVRKERVEEAKSVESYYVVEHRELGEYRTAKGEMLHNVPIATYKVKRQSGSITNGEFISNTNAGTVDFNNLPKDVKSAIGKEFAGIRFGCAYLLPFKGWIGCELMKFTDSINGLPGVPFGESLLANIISHLETWDYYSACANTDMYLGKGRVMMPKPMQGANSGTATGGFDDFMYAMPNNPQNPEAAKPFPIQFQLRASEWTEIRTRIIQDIAITTGLNASTIASFISDNAAKTAREISTDENETADYINDKRSLIEKPLNKIIAHVLDYLGVEDNAVIRWSTAGLTNRYSLAEIVSMGLQGGFISKYKAVQMFNFDDDTEQVQEEFERIKEETQLADYIPEEGMNDDETEITERGTESIGIEY